MSKVMCSRCKREPATRTTRSGPDTAIGRLLCWAAVVDVEWARDECKSYQSSSEAERVRGVLLSSVQMARDLAEARKQRDHCMEMLRELLDDSMPVQYGERRRRALEFLRVEGET